jgi:hypothetical protein
MYTASWCKVFGLKYENLLALLALLARSFEASSPFHSVSTFFNIPRSRRSVDDIAVAWMHTLHVTTCHNTAEPSYALQTELHRFTSYIIIQVADACSTRGVCCALSARWRIHAYGGIHPFAFVRFKTKIYPIISYLYILIYIYISCSISYDV